MKNERSFDMFASMPVHKAVLKNVLPAMASMLILILYNLADTYFVGQLHDPIQLAAVALSIPVVMLFSAIGTIFGVGGTSVIARSLGEGKVDHARKVSAFCFWGSVVVGTLMSVLLWIFMDQFLPLIGASSETLPYAKNYMRIILLAGPFAIIGNAFPNILRAEGRPNKAMVSLFIGNILNIILDPILILWLGWEIEGAAIATIIGQIVTVGYILVYYLRGQSKLSIKLKEVSIKNKVLSGVTSIGIPVAFGTVLMSLSQIIMNSKIAGYSDLAVAGLGVTSRITLIIGMLCIGIGQGVQPLLGYCIGAKLWDRYKSIFKFSLVFAFVVSVALAGISYIFINQIVGGFISDPTALEYGVRFGRILLSSSVIVALFFILTNAMQAAGAAFPTLIINLSRQGLIFIPALFLFSWLFGMNGVVWAQPIADVISFVIAVILNIFVTKKMMNSKDAIANNMFDRRLEENV